MSLTINHQTNDISATSGSMTIDGSAVGGGGGGGAFNLISTTTISSAVSSIAFTGLTTYANYFMLLSASMNYSTLTMRYGINGTYDSGNNYRNTTSGSGSAQFDINSTGNRYGVFGNLYIYDLARTSTSNYRRGGYTFDGIVAGSSSSTQRVHHGGYWGQQGSNSIELTASFNNGTVSLYGISI